MVSFDVEALYPSVPRNIALSELKNWLQGQALTERENETLFEMAKLCLNQSFFQFRNKYYKQSEGMAMGDCLAPFLASDIFLGKLETEMA